MQSNVIILDTTGTTYIFYEIEKQKETIKEKKNQKRQIEREKQKRKGKIEEPICRPPPPSQAGWPTLEKEQAR